MGYPAARKILMSHRPTVIYALSDPRKRVIPRYIGKTGNRLGVRLSQHIQTVNRYRTKSASWIKSLLKRRIYPMIWPLEVCEKENWEQREKYWISFFRPLGTLTNLHEGGVGSNVGIKTTAEWREKLRKSHLGKKLTPEQRERCKWMRSKRKRTQRQKEQFEQMLRTRKLPTCSPEAIERGRLTKIGKPCTEKQRECLKLGITATRRGVTCLSTGKEFDSLADAGRSIGIDGCKIGRSIRTNGTCGGMIWAYTDTLLRKKKG